MKTNINSSKKIYENYKKVSRLLYNAKNDIERVDLYNYFNLIKDSKKPTLKIFELKKLSFALALSLIIVFSIILTINNKKEKNYYTNNSEIVIDLEKPQEIDYIYMIAMGM